MDTLVKFLSEFLSEFFGSLWSIFTGILEPPGAFVDLVGLALLFDEELVDVL